MLLFQASAGDAVTSMVLSELRKYAPVLEYLQFFKADGSGATERYGDDIDGTLATRTIGNDFSTKDVEPDYGTFALKILGKNVRIDIAYEERGGDVPSEFQIKLKNWAMNAGRNFMYYLIDGNATTDATQFNGLRKIIALLDAAGVSDRVISPAGDNGLQIPLGNDNTARKAQQQFLELLDNVIESVDGGANCLMMDGLLLNRLSAVAKEMTTITLNQYDAIVGSYKGIPVVPTSRKYDGTRIIPWSETVGTSTDCSSVFAFHSAEKADLTAMTTRTGLKVYPMEKVSNFYQHMVQLQMDIAALSNRCVAKLEGLRLG
jgi:hypothetical protein